MNDANTSPVSRRIQFVDFLRKASVVFDEIAREGTTVAVERKGKSFRIEPEAPGRWESRPSVARVRAALRATAGAFKHVDVDALVDDIREARGQRSTGRPTEL